MAIKVGPPVTGDDFKFRDKEASNIITMLEEGNSVLLIGLRRIGKTSLMKTVEERAPDDWLVHYHSVQDKRAPSDLFTILLKSLSENDFDRIVRAWSQAKTIPARLINGIKQGISKLGGFKMDVEFNERIIEYWRPLTAGVETVIAEKYSPVVLILDEFPFFIEHMLTNKTPPRAVEEMLGLLKRWRGDHPHFRLLIGGSISFDRVLAKWNIDGSTINDFLRVYLPPLSREQAREFLRELAASNDMPWYDDEKIDQSLDLLEDYYPFFLNAFFLQLKIHGGADASLSTIFNNHFIPSIQQSYFSQFSDRLKKHYSVEQRRAARAMFGCMAGQAGSRASYSQLRDVVSKTPDGDQLELDDLLSDLVSDEFLTLHSRTSEYGFSANLIVKWHRITRGK